MMICKCIQCEKVKAFKDTDDALKNNWELIGINIGELEWYSYCEDCMTRPSYNNAGGDYETENDKMDKFISSHKIIDTK